MSTESIPDLHIRDPQGGYGPGRFNLSRFLYKGAASAHASNVFSKIQSGFFGEPQLDRFELLLGVKECIEGRWSMGQATSSIGAYVDVFKLIVRFLEDEERSFELSELERNYLDFGEFMFDKVHREGSLKNDVAANILIKAGGICDSVLGIPKQRRSSGRVRIKKNKTSRKALGKEAEKQSLEDTFKLGRFLTDLSSGLTEKSIKGQLPLIISMRAGLVKGNQITLLHGLGYHAPGLWAMEINDDMPNRRKGVIRFAKKRRERIAAPVADIQGSRRYVLVNLRIKAEYMIFLAMTGMNPTNAANLKIGRLKYKPLGDGYQVTIYKKRRGGEATFFIYKEFKPHLSRYVSFLKAFFPKTDFLFPILDNDGLETRRESDIFSHNLSTLRSLVASHQIPWISPKTIRNSRVNWFLRRSGDEDLSAESAQHSKIVMKEDYEKPSQQRAMIEATRFWNKYDPLKESELVDSIVGGQCSGTPEPLVDKPSSVVEPNCINPSGCLWCKCSRDIDSFDYVWKLLTFRHLKIVEASVNMKEVSAPADLIVDRIVEKIDWFSKSSEERRCWVEEAEQRVDEGGYHQNFSRVIEFLER